MSITHAYPRLFADDWLVTHDYEEEILGIVKMGKESEVSLIARTDATRTCYIAEKRFKSRGYRAFRDDLGYRSTWFRAPGDRRARSAMLAGTRFGRQIVERAWYAHEWAELCHLYEAGVTVPPPVELLPPTKRPNRSFHWRPINAPSKGGRDEETEGAYRMAFIGDPPSAAPRLSSVHLAPAAARRAWERVLHEVELMLRAGRIHGDLSAYNVLWWRERPVIIDLSQTVDLTVHPAARELLRRDLEQVAAYFRREGVDADVDRAWRRVSAEAALRGRW
jgi:RIO kinase 1